MTVPLRRLTNVCVVFSGHLQRLRYQQVHPTGERLK